MPVNHESVELRCYLNKDWLQRYTQALPEAIRWWNKNDNAKSRFGLEKSTARAYSTGGTTKENGPVAVFNEWAEFQVDALQRDSDWRRTLATPQGFARAHAGFASSLADYWKARVADIHEDGESGKRSSDKGNVRRVTRELSVGQKYKLVDLFVRYLWLARSDRSLDAQSNLPYGHAPLDRKSLHVLSATFGGILMAPEFRMGMVVTEEQYRYCQSLIRLVCAEAGGTPLLFDVFAWHNEAANQLYGAAPKRRKKS